MFSGTVNLIQFVILKCCPFIYVFVNFHVLGNLFYQYPKNSCPSTLDLKLIQYCVYFVKLFYNCEVLLFTEEFQYFISGWIFIVSTMNYYRLTMDSIVQINSLVGFK